MSRSSRFMRYALHAPPPPPTIVSFLLLVSPSGFLLSLARREKKKKEKEKRAREMPRESKDRARFYIRVIGCSWRSLLEHPRRAIGFSPWLILSSRGNLRALTIMELLPPLLCCDRWFPYFQATWIRWTRTCRTDEKLDVRVWRCSFALENRANTICHVLAAAAPNRVWLVACSEMII